MLAYDIPFEILSKIAILLSVKDKIQCILTCKAWQSPFQDVLWDTISVFSKEKVREICDSDIKANIYKQNGGRVKLLIFGRRLRVSDQDLNTIQHRFKNLQSFCAPDSSLSSTEFGKIADWKLWNSLKELDIFIPVLDKVRSLKESLKILSNLPSLRRLHFTDGGFEDSPIYTLRDIEALHTHLPKLESLSIQMVLAPLEPEDIQLAKNTIPANTLTVLEIKLEFKDYRWLYYFARKYYNLCTLSWDSMHDMDIDDFKDSLSHMLSDISPVFPHLNSITVSSICCSEQKQATFWRIFDISKSTIKDARFLFTGVNDGKVLLEEDVKGCIELCSRTLEKLSVTCDVYAYNSDTISLSFNTCPRLVELYLDVRFLPIELDTLLDQCMSLKSIKLSVDSPSVSPSAFNDIMTHGVGFIELITSKLDTSILKYISFRCRKLYHMRLCDVLVYGPISQETGNIYIDMSHTHFEFLHLDQVHFYPSNKPYCMMNGNKPQDKNYLPDMRTIPVRILEICQQKNGGHDKMTPSIKDKYKQPSIESIWLHTYHCPEAFYPWKSVRVLKKREVKMAKRYFCGFQRKSTRDYVNMTRENAMIEMVLRHEWKSNLLRGYVTFRCGDIKKYRVTGHTVSNDALWRKISGES
ncbi:hypothetical protein F4703DRAFT_1977536 [Phycomyces blakesleeanus]